MGFRKKEAGESSDYMNSEELKSIIEKARIEKGISQRELAKISGISRSTLNDIINGKIKKVDVDALKKIAETLDLSLIKLLKCAGYNEFIDFLQLGKYNTTSTKDLRDKVEEYENSETELLNFDYEKRRIADKVSSLIFLTAEHLRIMLNNKDSDYKVEDAIESLDTALEMLKPVKKKYDYRKLPERFR